MKICWDSLEKLIYRSDRNGWLDIKWKNKFYIYMDECKMCNNPYLTLEKQKGLFCDNKCSTTFRNIGNEHSEETKRKIGLKSKIRTQGKDNPNYKGGVKKKNIPLYNTYAHQIDWCEQVRRSREDKNILEVKCAYCGKWYIPTTINIQSRIQSLNGNINGEYRLYCSNDCKKECPIYHKIKYSIEESNTKQYLREVQPELRQLVFERDKYICQKCGSIKSLHCHHITGVELNPIESADIDNCITLCKKCHKEVHKQDGCKTSDFRRKKC